MAEKRSKDAGTRWRRVNCAGLEAPGCDCRTAVRRAFDGMLVSSQSTSRALDVALTVYSYHHPEVPLFEARETVTTWLARDRMH